jgi:hypothetical protein
MWFWNIYPLREFWGIRQFYGPNDVLVNWGWNFLHLFRSRICVCFVDIVYTAFFLSVFLSFFHSWNICVQSTTQTGGDFRLSRRWRCWLLSFGFWRRCDLVGGCHHFGGMLVTNYKTSQTRRPHSTTRQKIYVEVDWIVFICLFHSVNESESSSSACAYSAHTGSHLVSHWNHELQCRDVSVITILRYSFCVMHCNERCYFHHHRFVLL